MQAVGAAALVPSSLALVLRATAPARIPFVLAIWGATGAVAGAIGPTLGAALVEAGGWRWVFVVNLPVGVATVVLGRRVLAESRGTGVVLPSPLGVALLVAGSSFVTLALVKGDEWGWLDAGTAGSMLAGLAVLALFVVHQTRTAAPTIDLTLFQVRNFRWGNLATVVFGTAFTAMFLSSILFLTGVWRWSILAAGFGVAPGPLLVALLAPVMGRLATRIGQRPLLIVGGVAYGLGGLWRVVALGPESDYVRDYLPTMLLTGVGVAMCLPQLSSVIGQALPPDRLGVGGGVSQALRQFGGTVGVALAVGLIGEPIGVVDALSRFDRVWWLLVAGGAVTSLCAIPLQTRPAVIYEPVVAPSDAPAVGGR